MGYRIIHQPPIGAHWHERQRKHWKPEKQTRSTTNSGTIFQKLQPVSKKMQVVTKLEDAILSGTLQSGDQIVEGKLAQQLGVGQELIREALIELEHQGLLAASQECEKSG